MEQGDEGHTHVLSQRASWEWKKWLEYGTNVMEIDWEIVNPHDFLPVKHL
jgi:hypothetical protein